MTYTGYAAYAANTSAASAVTLDVASWERMYNHNIKLNSQKSVVNEPGEPGEPDEWFVCSFCCQIVVDKPCFMVGPSCVCALCKADDELVDDFIEMNEISQEDRRELLEIYALDEPEYRGERKKEEVIEEIDCTLCENFDNEDNYNILYGEGASDDEE